MNSSTGVIFWITAIITFAVIVAVVLRIRSVRTSRNSADGVTHSLDLPYPGSLRLTATELIEGYADNSVRHPLVGLRASVDDSGTVNRRMTMTRILALGPLAIAAPKKLDDRCLYLTIDGPDTIIVREISLKNNATLATQAREFAARINHLGGVSKVPDEPPSLTATASARLEELGRLRDAGHITAEEFDAKRAEILNEL